MVKKRKATQVIIRAETETDLAKILANLRSQGETVTIVKAESARKGAFEQAGRNWLVFYAHDKERAIGDVIVLFSTNMIAWVKAQKDFGHQVFDFDNLPCVNQIEIVY